MFYHPLKCIVLIVSVFVPFLLLVRKVMASDGLLFCGRYVGLLVVLKTVVVVFTLSHGRNHRARVVQGGTAHGTVFLAMLFLFNKVLCQMTAKSVVAMSASSFLVFLVVGILYLRFNVRGTQVSGVFGEWLYLGWAFYFRNYRAGSYCCSACERVGGLLV